MALERENYVKLSMLLQHKKGNSHVIYKKVKSKRTAIEMNRQSNYVEVKSKVRCALYGSYWQTGTGFDMFKDSTILSN